jgi:hypothetical protein
MLDRARLWLLAASLGLMLGLPAPVMAATDAGLASCAAADSAWAANTLPRHDPLRGGCEPRSDEQDDPDRAVWDGPVAPMWPPAARTSRQRAAASAVRPTHRACAAPPRGPPSA